jgi:hypothetical protein
MNVPVAMYEEPVFHLDIREIIWGGKLVRTKKASVAGSLGQSWRRRGSDAI